MVQSKLLKLVKSVPSVAGPTNAQKYNMKSHSFCTDKVAELVRPSHAVRTTGLPCWVVSAA
eukprot:1156231-Pelagomonas_calceolata.AAC.3